MRSSDLAWFGLRSAPFSKEIGDDDLWMPTSKTELVDDLADAVEAHATVLLTGEPGVGKTCVLRALRRRLSPDSFRLTYCHNATLGRRDFYRQLCVALGLMPSATAAGVFYAVSTHIEELGKERVHPVFLLDEAHLLHQDVLDCARRPIVDARIGALWTAGSGHCGQRERPRGHRDRGTVDAEIAVVDSEIGFVDTGIGHVDSEIGRSRGGGRITFESVT